MSGVVGFDLVYLVRIPIPESFLMENGPDELLFSLIFIKKKVRQHIFYFF
jgi:hypothetical protein